MKMKNDAGVMKTDRPVVHRRPFGLLDSMILVVAIALGMAWCRPEMVHDADYITNTPSPVFLAYMRVRAWIECGVVFLSVMTLAQMALRLRRPRPSWRYLMRQPGWIACLSAMLVISTSTLKRCIGVIVERVLAYPPGARSFTYLINPRSFKLGSSSFAAGCAVGVSWVILRLGRRWKSEPGWVDGFGRVLGCTWLAMIPIQSAFEIAWPFL